MNKNLSLVALLSISAAPIFAQDVAVDGEITISAALSDTEVEETGAQVEVLDADDIVASQNVTLSETLGNLAGVSVNRSGGVGTNSAVLIRGSKQYENKILIDGFDFSDPSAPQEYYNLGTGLNLGADRIEVVKGSQSGIYGSGAIGGVVTVSNFSDIEDGLSVSGQFEYGSYNTYSEMLKVTYGGSRADVGLVLSGFDTDGFSTADENAGNTETDGSKLRNAAAYLSYDVSDFLTIGVNGIWEDSEYMYDFASGDGDQTGYKDMFASRVFASYEDAKMSHEFSYSNAQTERSDISVDPVWGAYEAGYETTRTSLKYDGHYVLSDALGASLGLERQNIEVKGTVSNIGQDFERQVNSVYAGLDLAMGDRLDVDVIARYDDDEFAGDQYSGRLAASFRPTDNLTIKSSLSTGYRAPSLYELFNAYYGNPDLEIEETLSFDLGAEVKLNDNFKIGATVFAMNTENFIGFDYVNGYQTLKGTTERRGVEVSGSYEIDDRFDLSLGYTKIDAKTPDGVVLGRIPESEFNMGLNGETAYGLTYGVTAKMVSGVQENVVGTITDMDDYTLVNARLGYQIGGGEVYVRAENIFDEQYQTAQGYGTSDRAFYVGFRVDF